MKPGYIFAAVLLICLSLGALLPHLATGTGSAVPEAHAAVEPTRPAAQEKANSFSKVAASVDAVAPTATTASQDAAKSADAAASSDAAASADAPASSDAAAPTSAPAEPAQPAVKVGENSAQALDAYANQGLQEFAAKLAKDQPGTVTGVYAPGLFALPVTGQPAGDQNFVSTNDNQLTLYAKPADYGVTAVLAHNNLSSGKSLARLRPDQEVYVIYGDGRAAQYRVTQVQYYQALSPNDVRSDFRDLNSPGGKVLSYDQLFNRVYTESGRLVFQTCLEANGDPSWGRIFISAKKTG